MEHWHEEQPRTEIKACLLIVHGAGEHSARHLEVAQHFVDAGFYVGMGDLPGHGRTAGRRGHIDTFQTYIDTVVSWAHKLQERFSNVPRFILGHSMGGLITARFIQQQASASWNGVLLSAPCLALALPVPNWKKQMALWLDQWWPMLRLNNGIEPNALCSDPEVQAEYKNDPLVENKVSVRWFCELQKAMEVAHKDVAQFNVPVWIIQGGADRIVDPSATREWFERLHVQDKQLVWVKDGYHELLRDVGRREWMEKMLEWTENHI